MTSMIILLTVGILLLALLTIWLYLSLQKANDKYNRLKRGNSRAEKNELVNPAQFVGPLIRERDPLGNILQFMYNYEQGTATAEQGYEACGLLLATLERSCGLRAKDSYRNIVRYDPLQHRLPANVQVAQGESVVVIDPGWWLGNESIKYTLVTLGA